MAAENLQSIIAGNIAALRRTRGYTQAELADKLGYSDKSVSKWERGDGLPDVLCLKAMADLFGVTVDYMLTADHPDTAPDPASGNGRSAPAEVYQVNRRNIAALSVAGVWLLAGLVILVFYLLGYSVLPAILCSIVVIVIQFLISPFLTDLSGIS